ncbi:aldo/keto reductase [Streptomyces sp. SID10853]|uniref:aldo/keto reductase n=1 Tax=Streptomyces sp. SID10853 TaxID=2706028 RepID=UPI0013C05101|nr:aldo/keto reductase [Streptomyces sp. SID10853]
MRYRTLGPDGPRVSALGLGTTSLMGIFGKRDPDTVADTLRRGLDLGINLVDTAPSYGKGFAETVLGEVLRGRRDEVVVSTKIGCWSPEEFDFSPGRIRSGLEDSLRRLGTDHVDVLLAHDIEYGGRDEIIGTVLPLLASLKREGKARAVGVSGLPLPVLESAVAAGGVDVVLSYCRYGPHDTALEKPVADWRALGVATLLGSPAAMGLLTQAGPPSWHPAPPALREAAARAAALCADRGADLALLALQFALAQDDLAAVLTGTGDREHLEASVRAAATAPDEELLADVLALFADVPGPSWPSDDGNWPDLPA